MSVTGKPYFPPLGYLVIKPMSPVSLRIVGDTTEGSRMEGVLYEGVGPDLVMRELEEATAIQ